MPARLVVAMLIAAGALRCVAGAVAVTDPQDARIVKSFLKHVEGVPAKITPAICRTTALESTEEYTWQLLPQLDMPLTAYRLTGDVRHLDIFVRCFENMRGAMTKGPDGYLGWYGKPLEIFRDPANPGAKLDVMINSFRTIDIVCRFLAAVAASGALEQKYGRQATEYLDLLENHLFKKWDARGRYVDLGEKGGVYRSEEGLRDVKGTLTQPNNKHSIIARALLRLHGVTGKDEYFARAVKIGARFKRCLKLRDGHYEWNYWDPAGAWDVDPADAGRWKHWLGVEHRAGYYASSVDLAVRLYHHGVVFDRTDIDRFLKTQLTMAWNGTVEKPQWFRVDRSPGRREGEYMADALAPFDESIERFLFGGTKQDEQLSSASHPWRGGVLANYYLTSKYLDLPAAKGGAQACLARGRAFLAKDKNAAFAKQLAYTVTGAGYSAPPAPKQFRDLPPEPKR